MSAFLGLSSVETLLAALEQAPLVLGEVTFTGFEVPSRISIGGAHAVTIHKLPGGRRVVDAMGVDDAAISWSGYFTGPEAAMRARLVDAMRQNGDQVSLSFGDYVFSVIVVHFEYDLQDRGAVISYRIRTERVSEQIIAGDSSLAGIFSSLLSDIATAAAYASGGASAASVNTLATLQASAALVTEPSSSSGLTSISTVLQEAVSTIGASVSSNGSIMTAASGSGALGINSAGMLNSLTTASGSLAASVQSAAYLNRAAVSTGQLAGEVQGLPTAAA